MDETVTASQKMFATNNTTIFDRFTDSVILTTYCLKLVLSVRRKQKSLLLGTDLTLVPPLADCLNHLRRYNQTILIKLIRQYNSTTVTVITPIIPTSEGVDRKKTTRWTVETTFPTTGMS